MAKSLLSFHLSLLDLLSNVEVVCSYILKLNGISSDDDDHDGLSIARRERAIPVLIDMTEKHRCSQYTSSCVQEIFYFTDYRILGFKARFCNFLPPCAQILRVHPILQSCPLTSSSP